MPAHKRYPKPEDLHNYTPVLRPMPLEADVMAHDTWQHVCVLLPRPLIPYLLGVMEIYRWQDRIIGTPEEKAVFASLWVALMAHIAEAQECEDGYMFKLRQSPTNPCHLEQSMDGGNTWLFAFDYSKCRPLGNRVTMTNYTQNIVNENNQRWIDASQNVSTYAPTLVYTGGGDDVDRDRALCTTANMFIDVLKDYIMTEGADDEKLFGSALGQVVGGIAQAGIAGGIKGAWGGALGAGIGGVIGIVTTIGSLSELHARRATLSEKIEAKRDDLVCTFYNALNGQTPTQNDFEAIFEGYPDVELRETIQEFMLADGMYPAFLRAWEESYRYAKSKIYIGTCADDCAEWEHTFDFTVNEGGWNVMATPAPALGVYQSGNGWVAQYALAGSAYDNRARVERVGFASTEFTHLTVVLDFRRGTVSISPNTTVRIGSELVIAENLSNQSTLQQYTLTWNGSVTANRMDFRIFPYSGANTSVVANRGELVVRSLTVRGKGVNPFV